MARIELNVVALGDFSSINSQIKALQTQVDLLNKRLTGVGVTPALAKDLNLANAAFKSAVLSSGQFTAQTVRMKNETEKFGQALIAGKLKITDYFGIITGRSTAATASLKQLAAEQVKLQNSVVMSDPTKRGIFTVYTPTMIDSIRNATKLAKAQQDMYNMSLEGSSKALINWGKNTQWAGRQLTVGLTMPMVLFGTTAAKTFQQVNEELVRLQKVYGTGLTQPTQQALDAIKKQTMGLAKELASTLGVSAKDTAAMAADLAATGKTGNDLLVATREAIRLSKLGELDTQQAMQATVSLQNVYKLSTQDLSKAVDFLNAVENQTSTSLQDLVDGIPRVGPIVQQLGGSFKDTAVMMVAMKEAGVPAAQSANAIKSALASLINPTRAARDAFRAYNIDLTSIASSTGGNPVLMIESLQKALKGLAPLAQAQLIEKLFGKFQEARIQALITNLGAVNSQTKTAFDLVNASAPQLAAVAANEMRIATESTTGKFKRSVESLKADLLPVGEKIMQIATVLLKIGDSIANTFGGLPGPVKSVLEIFAGGAAIAGPIIMLTGLFGNFAGYLLKTIYNLRMLASGGGGIKQLLTPEIVASTNAAKLFGEGIMSDVTAVDTLNGAMERLIVTMEGLVAAMGGTAGGLTKTIVAAEAGLAGGRVPFKAPKMAKGGFVPGDPAQGDIHPAVLTGGEAVIPAGPAQQYRGFISALIRGDLGQHAHGIDPLTGKAFDVQRGHAVSGHGDDVLSLMNSPEYLAQQGGYKLTEVNRVTKGAIMGQTSWLNQLTKGSVNGRAPGPGASASTVLDEYAKMDRSGLNPMAELEANAKKLGADMNVAGPELKAAYNKIIADIKAMDPSTMFGMGKGQIPLETFIEERLRPALQKIDTAAGITLDEVTQNTIGTRGKGRGRSGSSGAAFYREADGRVVPFSESTPGRYLSSQDVHTQGDPFLGARSGTAKAYNAGAGLVDDAKKGAKARGRIKSPSETFAQEVGVPLSQGTALGIKEGAAEVEAAAASTIDSAVVGGEKQVEKTKGRRMGLGTKMGLSMGLMMGGTALASALPKGSVASSLLGSTSSMAGMGMMFGPWGAAAGAAIGLVTGGISALMKAEKEHAAMAAATFKASSDAIDMFGGKLKEQTPVMHVFATETKGTSKDLSELQKQVNGIKALGKDSALKMVAELIKGMTSASSVIGTVKQFAAAQVANGMDPAKVKDMVTAMLTYSGQTQYLDAALKEITSSTKDVATATQTWLTKLKQASGTFSITSSSYSNLNDKQKQLANSALQVMNQILDTNTSFEQALQLSTGLARALGNTTDAYNLLIAAANNAKDVGLSKELTSLMNSGVDLGVAGIYGKLEKDNPNVSKDPKKLGGLIKAQLELEAQRASASNKAAMAEYNIKVAAAKKAAEMMNSRKDALSIAKDELKVLQDQLKTEQQVTSEVKRQQDYQLSQSDLENQIRLAQANGDFLKASLLKQQQGANTTQYKEGTKTSAMQKAIDEKQAEVDRLQAAADAAANVKSAGASVPKPTLQTVNTESQIVKMVDKFVTALANYLDDKKVKESTQFNSGSAAAAAYTAKTGISQNASWFDKGTMRDTNIDSTPTHFAQGMGYTNGTSFYIDHNGLRFKYTMIQDKSGNLISKYESSNKIPARASGGPVSGNKPYLVGENGPEMFVPNINGLVLPNIGKNASGAMSWLSHTALETIGILPALRLITGKKQSNWDYLGAGTMALGGFKAVGILPKLLKPLFAMAETTDLTQNAGEAYAQTRNIPNAHSTNHEYNLHMTFNGSQMNPDDVARTVMDTIKRTTQSNASFTNRVVK